jgi:hypothetical protein
MPTTDRQAFNADLLRLQSQLEQRIEHKQVDLHTHRLLPLVVLKAADAHRQQLDEKQDTCRHTTPQPSTPGLMSALLLHGYTLP